MSKGLIIFLYVLLFIVSFVVGFFFKLKILSIGSLEAKWTEQLGKAIRDIPYGEGELEKINLYLPNEKTDKLVVMVHGGGFTAGDRKDCEHNCASAVQRGYASVAPGYTISNKEHPGSILKMAEEICDAVQKAYDTCKENGCDIQQIALFGFSAGSCLALLYGYKYKDRWPCPVKFIFDGVGPTDFDASVWSGKEATLQEQADWAKAMFSKDYSEEEIANGIPYEDLKQISACQYVSADNPPTIFAYGTYDKIVPLRVFAKMRKRLDEVKPVYDYFEFDKSGHGLQNNKETSIALDKKINEYYEKYFTK